MLLANIRRQRAVRHGRGASAMLRILARCCVQGRVTELHIAHLPAQLFVTYCTHGLLSSTGLLYHSVFTKVRAW